MNEVFSQFEKKLTYEKVGYRTKVSLSEFSQWKTGGIAELVIRPSSSSELRKVLNLLAEFELMFIVIGGTTNLLFSDKGLAIPAIQLSENYANIECYDNIIRCQAGCFAPYLARFSQLKGLSGLEHIVGIPGTVGGLTAMNGGSLRKGIGDSIIDVSGYTKDGRPVNYLNADCKFAYRKSIFQNTNVIISEIRLALEPKDKRLVRQDMLKILKSRRLKFPRKIPNCGSVFVSDPEMYEKFGPPGAIIENLGLKGEARGGAEISALHANFILNKNRATSSDILFLIQKAKREANEKFGVNLKSEVKFLSEQGQFSPADKVELD
jgi:UDP-N-acetylmuramate dehydrogenase